MNVGDGRGRADRIASNPARPRLLTRARRAAFGAFLLVMVTSTLVSVVVSVVVGRSVLADDAARRLDRALRLAEVSAQPTDVASLEAFGRVEVRDGQPVDPVGEPADRGELADVVREAAARGVQVERRIHVNGRSMDVRAVPEGGADTGTVLVGVVTSHDPTARSLLTRVVIIQGVLLAVMAAVAALVSRRTTGIVESMFKQEDHLMRSVAHELRNPLSKALVAVDEGLAGESPPDEALGEAATLMVSVDELISDLLEMARVMTGGVSLPRETVALDRVAIDAVAMSPVAPCTVELDVAPTTVIGSARLLRRATSNLVRNAAAHAYGGGPGVIRVRVDGDGVSVADDGAGVPEEELGALRFEGKVGHDQQGAGLGLNLCGWVAEMHGGRLVLANRPGGGFVASIALPDAVVVADGPAATPARGSPVA
jgi:signal transduction histidine kinase